jgi:trk system potassium uptake protein TrkH
MIMEFSQRVRHLTSSQVIILGFALVILGGALLLMLPISSRDGSITPFINALFTSTSAVCVTGLVVYDTATYWSEFGQAVILLLIQIGGLGVVTVAGTVSILSGRRIGLMQRSTMQEVIAAPKMGGIVRLTGFIVKTVFLMEFLGAVSLATVFCRDFGFFRGLWYALFHSISAFCNAGFDLMGVRGAFSSLTSYEASPVVNVTIMLLIVIGGIGFLTWEDIRANRLHLKRYFMQSKVILCSTALLILLPALYFFFFEFGDSPLAERIWLSLFQSVTPRTAGFNTADLTAISEPGQFITIVLMLIGGSPGSTAGGMKTTTAAVLVASAIAVFRHRESANLFHRRVAAEAVRHAATLLMMYLLLFSGGAVVISLAEGLPMLPCLFETASAIGTVGLTLGLTPGLGLLSKLILISLMYFGRVGGLTLVFAAFSSTRIVASKLPQERINVG